ncbi:hypothetical protein, partial [Pedobacter panaciterrae]|uniref:hypothetical protein n=1 Tax=Pedobacter panaciterrae TaxID=363849 RepID=UPI003F68F944
SRGILTCYIDDFVLGNRLIAEGVELHEANIDRGDLVPGPAELAMQIKISRYPIAKGLFTYRCQESYLK